MIREKGLDPIIIPPDVDETVPADIAPHIAVMFLALKKSLFVESIAIEKGYTEGETLIAADTIVVYRNDIIGKPSDFEDAYATLKKLCGEMHRVFTGVAVLRPGTGYRKVFYETSRVFFKAYTDEEIIQYVETKEPYDKAGGYAVQGTWGKYIDRIDGDVDNVIGLPWSRLKKELSDHTISYSEGALL